MWQVIKQICYVVMYCLCRYTLQITMKFYVTH